MSFWKQYRVAAYQDGLRASIGKKNISQLLETLYHISEMGLKKRKPGQEQYIKPLKERMTTKITPADRAETLFTTKTKRDFLDALTFTNTRI